jgi:hypothetical protein|tara:strand:+ start:805 stop:1065 length:261 start_codon:yes stop_codon:yes gene_type:complete
MYKELKADFLIAQENYEIIVSYIYRYESATYALPEHREVEVTEVHLQSRDKNSLWVTTDITDLYWDFIDADFIEDIENEAHEKLIG